MSHLFRDSIKRSPLLQENLFFRPTQANSNALAELNPLLQAAFPVWFRNEDSEKGLSFIDEIFSTLDLSKDEEKGAAYVREEASWRNMLVIQPPVKALHVQWQLSSMGETSKKKQEREFDQGVRMDVLYDLVQTVYEIELVCWFSICWHMIPLGFKGGVTDDDECGYADNEDEHEEYPGGKRNEITMSLTVVNQCKRGRGGRIGRQLQSLGCTEMYDRSVFYEDKRLR